MSGSDLTSLDLGHEFAKGSVAVETERVTWESTQAEREWDAVRVVLDWHGPFGSGREPEDYEHIPPAFPISLTIDRDAVTLPVEGVPIVFSRVGDATKWIAWAHIDDCDVSVRVRDRPIDDIRLVRVDPEAMYEVQEHDRALGFLKKGGVALWTRR